MRFDTTLSPNLCYDYCVLPNRQSQTKHHHRYKGD
jgi:hypothetical protein